MADRAIREFDGKQLLSRLLPQFSNGEISIEPRCLQINETTDLKQFEMENAWIKEARLVVKPDQLIKRRGKNGLIKVNCSWEEGKQWISERLGKSVKVDNIDGVLNTFIVEPFLPHESEDEYYVAIRSVREGSEILFCAQGGVDVGDVDSKAQKLIIKVFEKICEVNLSKDLLQAIPTSRRPQVASFIKSLFELYSECGFSYLEINPLVYSDKIIAPLDLAAKLDDTAHFECGKYWGDISFPPAFGHKSCKEEQYIRELDSKTGASLKFELLNPKGRVWTMVAGGGASVIYADTITDLGFGGELANYGEYSGNPTDEETYQYAKTVLDLLTKEPHPQGKILLIGGGIANFTDVAKTFGGITKALRESKDRLKENNVKIYVRRGGPNYKEGLNIMTKLGKDIGIPIEVYGPESHMTKIVSTALQQ